MAKLYFRAMDKEHITRMIEHAANRQNTIEELDSEELERVGPTGR